MDTQEAVEMPMRKVDMGVSSTNGDVTAMDISNIRPIAMENLPHPVKSVLLKNLNKKEAFNLAKAGANVNSDDVSYGSTLRPEISLKFTAVHRWNAPSTPQTDPKFIVYIVNETTKSKDAKLYWTSSYESATKEWTFHKEEEGAKARIHINLLLEIAIAEWKELFHINGERVTKMIFTDLSSNEQWRAAAALRRHFKTRFPNQLFPDCVRFVNCDSPDIHDLDWGTLLENNVEIHNLFGKLPFNKNPKGHTTSLSVEVSRPWSGIDAFGLEFGSIAQCFHRLFFCGDALTVPLLYVHGPFVEDIQSFGRTNSRLGYKGSVVGLSMTILDFLELWLLCSPQGALLNETTNYAEQLLPNRNIPAALHQEEIRINLSGDKLEDMAYLSALLLPKHLSLLFSRWATMASSRPWMEGKLMEIINFIERTTVAFEHRATGCSVFTLIRPDHKSVSLSFQAILPRPPPVPPISTYYSTIQQAMETSQITIPAYHWSTCSAMPFNRHSWDFLEVSME